MSEEVRIFSESNIKEELNNQIKIYRELQQRARSLLRLILAGLAVSTTVLSAILSGVIRTDFSIYSFSYYYNQATTSASPSGDILTALLVVYTIGILFIIASMAFAASGIIDVIFVTTYGIYPYMSGYLTKETKMTSMEGEVIDAKSYYVEENSQILSNMNAGLTKSYKQFRNTIIFLLVGSASVAAAHLVNIDVAQYILGILLVMSLLMPILELSTKVINIRTSKTRKKIQKADKKISKTVKFLSKAVPLFIISTLAGLGTYFFGNLRQVGIYLTIAIGIVLLMIVPIIHSERKHREDYFTVNFQIYGRIRDFVQSIFDTNENESNTLVISDKAKINTDYIENKDENALRISPLVKKDGGQTNYTVEISESALCSSIEELDDLDIKSENDNIR